MKFVSRYDRDAIKHIIMQKTNYQEVQVKLGVGEVYDMNGIICYVKNDRIIIRKSKSISIPPPIVSTASKSAIFVGKIKQKGYGSVIVGMFRVPIRLFLLLQTPFLICALIIIVSSSQTLGLMLFGIIAIIIGELFLYLIMVTICSIKTRVKQELIDFIRNELC
jgi:hypothetical protein